MIVIMLLFFFLTKLIMLLLVGLILNVINNWLDIKETKFCQVCFLLYLYNWHQSSVWSLGKKSRTAVHTEKLKETCVVAIMAYKRERKWQLRAACNPQVRWSLYHSAMLMGNLLRSKEYWDIVENKIPTLVTNATQEQKKEFDEAKLKELKANN